MSLMLVYVLVPNKKVRLDSALAGAAVAVVLFWFLRQGFALAVLNNATYKTLYAAMAVIPVFLIWMYLSWAVVIFGAVVTAGFGRVSSVQRQGNKKGNRCRQIRPALTFGIFHGQTRRRFFRPFKRQNPAKRGVFVLGRFV